MRTVVRKALRADPADRYASARELADALGKDVLLDWQPSTLPSGETRWFAERKGKRGLVVKLIQQSGKWAIEVYTRDAGGQERQKGSSVLWRNGLTRKGAADYLNDLFPTLE